MMIEMSINKPMAMIMKLVYGNDTNIQSMNTSISFSSCPNCETWVVNLSDHLRKTHRIASPVDRKPLLRMARLEKRRMTETANTSSSTNSTMLKPSPPSTLVMNGLPTPHSNTNEIENLLFKQENDTHSLVNQQYSVTIPENILLNQQMTNSLGQYTTPIKRQRDLDDHLEHHPINGPLSPNKKSRMGMIDGNKLSPNKTSKKNRNKQQQQGPPPPSAPSQTIIKTAASGIFPQQPIMNVQNMEESSDDVS